MNKIYSASTTAPVNIATLKYWGKRDTTLNLPTNSSISVTLSQDDLRTLTTASCSKSFTEDTLWLNGSKEDITGSKRLLACFRELRELRRGVEAADSAALPMSEFKLHLVSENNFPTAAGLASSAAGLAALVRAIADLYELPQDATELSKIARQGSGSACRSLFGGYVAWEMGSSPDGSDSKAVQIAPVEHWPEMRACILVVSADKKDTSSTAGMQVTVNTSPLFAHRINNVVPQRFELMKKSILDRDFAQFAQLTMQDSNSFHAVCLDSTPPIFYMNDISRAAIRAVDEINRLAGQTVAAYTFDAGPNAVIYYLKENAQVVLGPLKAALKSQDGWASASAIKPEVPTSFESRWLDVLGAGIVRVILTKVGGDPVSTSESLINDAGLP
ncbi:diphosphomevalonate decarboxylase [Nadsonia fulvescens var. elongata DSM 6958]|uniref:Diphosphomevalonate decarboxylase n=1 Tax=Nadsonia fulvescens var. elongata DSM 6958 TaxID=857566 RepID=A0A1E3PQY6_9ASCO|nr:diphosphomevalonate decarboxylase [Nadsonia fulvescens var. elongata DSM 6958]